MEIKVLGTGCAKCKKLYEEVDAVVKELGVEASIEKKQKMDEILKYGVALTPALVINEIVKSAGKIPSRETISEWIQELTNKE